MTDKMSRDTARATSSAAAAAPSPQGEGRRGRDPSAALGMTSKPSYWAVLPAAIRYDPEIPASAKLLYAEISSLTDERGYCWASNAYFERLYSLSERTIVRLIRALEKAGYIRILDAGGATRRKIAAGINPLGDQISPRGPAGLGRDDNEKGSDDAETPDKNVSTPLTKMSVPPDKNVTQNKKENKKENNPPKAPQGAGAVYEPKKAPDWKPERWEKFWAFYPLHKSKQAAIKAWDKLKPSDELLAVIGKALVRQIAEKQAECDRRRIPFEWKLYASSYLNGARWTDEEDEIDGPTPAAAPTGERRDLLWI